MFIFILLKVLILGENISKWMRESQILQNLAIVGFFLQLCINNYIQF